MKFPLEAGHVFGVANPYRVTVHDGTEAVEHELGLRDWQMRYQREWDRDQPITGRFDGPTQRACMRVQRERGLVPSNVLDRDTWDAVFSFTERAPEVNKPAESPADGSDTLPVVTEPVKPPTATLEAPNVPRRGRPPKRR